MKLLISSAHDVRNELVNIRRSTWKAGLAGWHGGAGMAGRESLRVQVCTLQCSEFREAIGSQIFLTQRRARRRTCGKHVRDTHAHWELARLYGPLSLLLPLAVWMCNLLFYFWENQKNHMQQGWAVVSGRAADAAAPPGKSGIEFLGPGVDSGSCPRIQWLGGTHVTHHIGPLVSGGASICEADAVPPLI